MEFGFGEAAMEKEDDGWKDGAHEESVGQRPEDGQLEKSTRPDENVLRAGGQGGGETLSRPLVCGVCFRTAQVRGLGIEHPPHHAVVDGDSNEAAEDLGEKGVSRGDVHVVADFLVLEHELCTIPGVAGDGGVNGCTGWILVSIDGIDHEPVQQLVEATDGELEVGQGIQPTQWDNNNNTSEDGDEVCPQRDKEVSGAEDDHHDDKGDEEEEE